MYVFILGRLLRSSANMKHHPLLNCRTSCWVTGTPLDISTKCGPMCTLAMSTYQAAGRPFIRQIHGVTGWAHSWIHVCLVSHRAMSQLLYRDVCTCRRLAPSSLLLKMLKNEHDQSISIKLLSHEGRVKVSVALQYSPLLLEVKSVK